MKNISLGIYCLLLLLFITSCQNEPPNTSNTEVTDSTITPPTTTTSEENNAPHAKEIALIDQKVQAIEEQLPSLTANTITIKGSPYKAIQYTNANNQVLKSLITHSTDSTTTAWHFYWLVMDNDAKNIYTKAIKKQMNQEVFLGQMYSIGSMIEGNENFGLLLDQEGKKLSNKAYQAFEQPKEKALMFLLQNQ